MALRGTTMTTILRKAKLAKADDRDLERYLSVDETAKFLTISQATVRFYLTKGKLKRYKLGSRTLIRLRDAEGLIREA
jgi:excisionase family DNA binding protein